MNHVRFFVTALAFATSAHADVKPAALFQDHAVLQRDKPVPVWGTADAGETVSVTFGTQTLSTVAAPDGRWSLTLAPLAANATPATLTLKGKNTIVLQDIVVGEVWLASGQSNMEWSLSRSYDPDLEQLTARFPLIREIKVKRRTASAPVAGFEGEWKSATSANVAQFSAVAYLFARDLHLALDVPVGIVNSTWGGTPVEAWIGADALKSDPAFAIVSKRWTKQLADFEVAKSAHAEKTRAWQSAKTAAEARGERFTETAPAAPKAPVWEPSTLYHGMITPLLPYSLRGAIWYQGESNAGRAAEYRALFGAMIKGWRADFAQGDFPFYWTQLASFRTGSAAGNPDGTDWAALREAQTQTLALPATGQAITTDVGDYSDIHPKAKLPVARRLARLALNRTYGFTTLADSGPVFAGFELIPGDPAIQSGRPSALRVNFTPADRGLRQPARAVAGFEVAGEDRIFHPAVARIEKGSVVVGSPAVTTPVAVRYAWRNATEAALCDDLGLPVPPFRSDNW
jgi:sialate O-acetylesterase